MEEPHPHEWPSMNNFTPEICWWLEKYLNNEEQRNKIFFETNAFAVEKLDGTNVSKDDAGQLYSRRLLISADAEVFSKTTLKHVKAADIKMVKKKLCEKIGLNESILEKLIVYGELVVNEKYDYRQRKLKGSWLVFGAVVIVKPQDLDLVSRKFKEGNFAFAREEGRIRIFASSTFFNLVKDCSLDIPETKGENLSLYDIVLNNKDEMETGKLEGVIITIKNYSDDYNDHHGIFKWKGAQEEQIKAQKEVSKALEILKEENRTAEDKTTQLFSALHAVVFAQHEKNPLVKKAKSKTKDAQEKSKPQTDKVDVGKNLDKTDKKIITTGVFSSMTKYDDVNVFIDTEDRVEAIIKYKGIIKEEVKQHFITEKGRQPSGDEEVFIKSAVESIVNGKIKIK